ncbi:hypothetical protein CPB84DRAFT_1847530 [Gymnopilus junonius]|uniref:Uncharacterized protein n=1 Tax=Gymnopilus junonius TaxID=109634 RepID=A0A9P5NJY7_GYMJU|nr:hypothetical protein CPB84DRAFT_1847530 [Gymnopilus junonius]
MSARRDPELQLPRTEAELPAPMVRTPSSSSSINTVKTSTNGLFISQSMSSSSLASNPYAGLMSSSPLPYQYPNTPTVFHYPTHIIIPSPSSGYSQQQSNRSFQVPSFLYPQLPPGPPPLHLVHSYTHFVLHYRLSTVEISNKMEKDGEKEARKSAEGESEKEPEVQDMDNGVVDDMDSGEVWVKRRRIGVGEVSGKEKDEAGEEDAGEDKALEDETGAEAGKGKNKRKGKGKNKGKVKWENNELGSESVTQSEVDQRNAKKRKACDDDAPEEIDHNEGKRKCNLSNISWWISSKKKKLKTEESNPPALTKSNSPPKIVVKSQPPRAVKPQPPGPPMSTSLSLTSKQIWAPAPRLTRTLTSRKLLGDPEDPQGGEGRAASGEKLDEENIETQNTKSVILLRNEMAGLIYGFEEFLKEVEDALRN